MHSKEEVPSATPKRFCSVRGLVGIGIFTVLLGLCSLLYVSRSSSPEIYQLLAAALVIYICEDSTAAVPHSRRRSEVDDEEV